MPPTCTRVFTLAPNLRRVRTNRCLFLYTARYNGVWFFLLHLFTWSISSSFIRSR